MAQKNTYNTKLTPRQLHFARCVASGMSHTDAYIESYTTENSTKKTVYENASRLANNPKVKARIEYIIGLKEQAIVRSSVQIKTKVLRKLEEFMDNATPNDSAKIRAAELLGKSIGLFKDVIDDSRNADKSPEELTAILEQKLMALAAEESDDDRTLN